MKHTMKDLATFFRTQRNFPSILFFGSGKNQIAGEGQSGGTIYERGNDIVVESAEIDPIDRNKVLRFCKVHDGERLPDTGEPDRHEVIDMKRRQRRRRASGDMTGGMLKPILGTVIILGAMNALSNK